jgi:tetratricopeptide (TPR) repeat protein
MVFYSGGFGLAWRLALIFLLAAFAFGLFAPSVQIAAQVLQESEIEEKDLDGPSSASPTGQELPSDPADSSVPTFSIETSPGGWPTEESPAPGEPLGEFPLSRQGDDGGTGTQQPHELSLIANITPQTPPQRAASLRITEEGRSLLGSGEYEKALAQFEKTMAIDSTNPYSHYYLARAHFHLGHYQQAFNFLDVAESLLSGDPNWQAEVLALKGANYNAMRFFERADANYSRALKLAPHNKIAFRALIQIRAEAGDPYR